MQFLAYEYRTNHMSIESDEQSHCVRYALNKDLTCTHIHTSNNCSESSSVEFFFRDLNLLLHHVLEQIDRVEDGSFVTEIMGMIRATNEVFEPSVTTYMAHQVRAYAQFAKIEEETESFSTTRCGLWFDHKQKILPTVFREGQIEYFGKRGMSLLGFMLIQGVERIVKDEIVQGLTYNFYDVVVDKYSSQDNVQVLDILQAMIVQIKEDFPEITELTLGSDNASCLASHDNIIFVHHLNDRLDGIKVRNWLYTEACTGKGRIDTHFSYLNLKLKAYVIDGNDIRTEDDIFTAMTFEGGLSGTSAILFDGSTLKGPVLNKEFKMTKTGVRETHEMLWSNDRPEVFTISNITNSEQVTARRLQNFHANIIHASIAKIHRSTKPSLFVPKKNPRRNVDNSAEKLTLKQKQRSQTVASALCLADIKFGPTIHAAVHNDASHKDGNTMLKNLFPGWACYPKQTGSKKVCSTTLKTLEELFQKGNQNKSSRISADRARIFIIEGLEKCNWYERVIVTEAKIKAYFGTTLTSRKKLMAEAEAMERIAAAAHGDATIRTEAVAAAQGDASTIRAEAVAVERIAAADGEATVRGEMAASEGGTIQNIETVNEEFDVMCRTVEMTAIKELENLHTEDLYLYDEENL